MRHCTDQARGGESQAHQHSVKILSQVFNGAISQHANPQHNQPVTRVGASSRSPGGASSCNNQLREFRNEASRDNRRS